MFADQSTRIPESFEATLDALAELFTSYPTLVLEIRGHTDRWERQPDTLARRRAQNVHAELKRRGVPESAIPILSCAETLPLEAAGEPANRRVDFVIRGSLGDGLDACYAPAAETCRVVSP